MGMGSALVVMALAGAAYGQELLPGGLVQLVPVTPVTGGAGPVDLYLVALNPDGTPATGLSLKATRTVGMDVRWTEVGGGVYKMPYDPPSVDAPSLVTATARGKLASRDKVSAVATFQVVPASPSFSAEVEPKSLVLGRDAGSALTFVADAEGVELRSTAGAIEGLARQADGTWTARFVPPKLKYPHVAVLVWASASDPLGTGGHAVVGLTGNADYPVKGPPGATVALEVGGRTFGPTTLGADGKGKIPLEAPPGITVGTQITTVAGVDSREELDLKVPETRRIALYPLPGSIAADPASAVPLRAVVVMPNGAPDENARPTFTVPSGSVSEVSHRGGGVYEATWHPGGGVGPGQVKVTLGSEVQTDVIPVVGVAPRATVTLSASPAAIAPETTAVEVTARLTDPTGGPVTGATVRVDVTGGQLSAPAVDVGGGEYRATVIPGPGALELRAHPLAAPSSEPVRAVRVRPSVTTVANDGATVVDLVVSAVDAQGAPVGEVPVTLALVQGDGVLSERELVTGPDGFARTRYTAGTSPAVIAIHGTSGALTGEAVLLQVPGGVAAVEVPGAEAVASTGVAEARLTVPRGVVTPGVVSSISLVLDTADVSAGESFTVTASPLDGAGATVATTPPEVVVTGGVPGSPLVSADGVVRITVQVPDGAAAPVVVTAKAGGVTQSLTVPVAAAVAVGEPPPHGTADVVGPTGPEPVAPPPRLPGGAPVWFRGRVSGMGSSYRYEQAPSADAGPLLPSRLAVGGPEGGAPASPVGGEIDLRAWGDPLGVGGLGVHGQFRIGSYGITAQEFGAVARDVLVNTEVDLLARYPFTAGGDRYWVGLKGGLHVNDFMLFQGECLDPGCPIQTTTLQVPALSGGIEAGADVGRLSLLAGYGFGLARFSQPYASAVDVNLGYTFASPWYADLGFSMLTRSIVLEGADSGLQRGTIDDAHTMLKLGIGLAL